MFYIILLFYKDPNKAIPKGTILAIIICSVSYAAVAIICAATVARAGTNLVELRLAKLYRANFLNHKQQLETSKTC